MRIISQRNFNIEDQKQFAVVSGDYNPIHVDEIASRRLLFGEPVVHGMHLVMWALEELVSRYNIEPVSIQAIQANFHKGILLGRNINLEMERDGRDFVLKIYENTELMVAIKIRFGASISYKEVLPVMSPVSLNSNWNDIGVVPLMYDSILFEKIFPKLIKSLPIIPPFQLSTLLATTRLVGMQCPGQNSLYSSFKLNFCGEAIGVPKMRYAAHKIDDVNGVTIKVTGPGFNGELRAYLRPAPVQQPSADDLKKLVTSAEFKEQRAIIIGGTRGLGEITAKLLSAGGADVTITYNKGVADADSVQKEIVASGGKCSIMPYNCEFSILINQFSKFTHLYYFATPRITTVRNGIFSETLFQKYCKYYVIGFFEAVNILNAPKVFYPSTISLSTDNYELAEYRAAKAAGEEICRQLRNSNFKIYSPRLPRLLTDQTNWFLPIKTDPAGEIMLNHLREMEKS